MKIANRKKHIIAASIIFGICLAGIITTVYAASKRNPLLKGMRNLAEETAVREEELGRFFWSNAFNQVGSGNVQAEYSLNLSGHPSLQNMTIGLDGTVKRDMERKLFECGVQVSIANVDLVEIYGYAEGVSQEESPEGTFYLQIPKLWEGSVVFGTEDIDRQWNESKIKSQLDYLEKSDFSVKQAINLDLFREVYIEPISVRGWLEEKEEPLKDLYRETEVLKLEKARKDGKIGEAEADELLNYNLINLEGEKTETDCYLAILPENELIRLFPFITEEVRLCVYLDRRGRIVRVCSVPGKPVITEAGEETFSLNLSGEAATIDRLEFRLSHTGEAFKILPETGEMKAEIFWTAEKEPEEQGSYYTESDCSFLYAGSKYDLSLEGTFRGENKEDGPGIFMDIDTLTLKEEENVLFRLSGEAAFEPLTEEIIIPSGKEWRIGDMGDSEAALFIAECEKNLYLNYSGYLRLLE